MNGRRRHFYINHSISVPLIRRVRGTRGLVSPLMRSVYCFSDATSSGEASWHRRPRVRIHTARIQMQTKRPYATRRKRRYSLPGAVVNNICTAVNHRAMKCRHERAIDGRSPRRQCKSHQNDHELATALWRANRNKLAPYGTVAVDSYTYCQLRCYVTQKN